MSELAVTLPLRTTNPLNGGMAFSKVAVIARSRDRAAHRGCARVLVLAKMRELRLSPLELVPCVVKLTRVSAGKMDDDGLAASCKGIRDGIADALQVDDGGPFVRFVYEQRKGPKKRYAVEVQIAQVRS